MNLINDTIKINFVKLGYLPDYPYHLISNIEMCDAFMQNGLGYFYDYYPLLDDSLKDQYQDLVDALNYHIQNMKDSQDGDYSLPDWVYSYMLGYVVSVNSDKSDIHDLLVSMNIDNVEDDFNALAESSCYEVSKSWLDKLANKDLDHRPPTLFGEPHVLKSLRINDPYGV